MKHEPQCYLTADALLLVDREVLLVQRKHDPYEGKWALPGGFVDLDEKVADAAARELQEETGISRMDLKQFGTYGDPGRDPRGRVVSVVYWCRPERKPAAKANDDAADCRWYHIDSLPDMAFDHAQILADAKDELLR